jgi:Tol biopolymer transport system component
MKTARVMVCAVIAIVAGRGQNVPVTREVTLTLTEGTSMAAAVSPDRRWIAIDLLGNIWVLPFRGGEARRITSELMEARLPTWSPDSEAIAFQGYDDVAWHIYVISRAGENQRQLTSGVFDDREPDWSHDGTRIAFSSDRVSGMYSIWQVIVATGEAARIGTRDGYMPCWTPNDQEVSFVSFDRVRDGRSVPTRQSTPGLWATDTRGRERLILPGKDDGMPASPAWSPNGRLVAYSSGGQLHVNGQAVTKNEDVFPFRPQWVTRNEIVYTADGRIKRRALNFDTVVDVPFKATVTLQRASYTIAHRPLESAQPQRVGGIVTPAVAPNGQAIAFVAMGDLWVQPVGGRAVRLTDDEAMELDPAWSPDGTQLAFSSDRGGAMDLWVHDFGTNNERRLTRDTGGRVSGAAWSPDGSQVAFLVDGRDLRTVQIKRGDCLGGGEETKLARELGRPTWAPGCRAVAVGALFPYSDRFREGLNQLLFFNFDSNNWSSSVLFPGHSAGNRQSGGPVWSPDGLQIAFTGEGRLWVLNVDLQGAPLGPPTAIADDEPEFPTWEGDSRHIVYLTPHGFRRVIADGSAPTPMPLDLMWKTSAPPSRVVVHAGRVLDGTIEGLRGETDIVIDQGIIRDIAGHDAGLHTGAVVDASDEIVMPGLIDMHAHHDRDYGKDFGRVWLAYGITSLRIPAINPYEGLELRESFDAGRRPGPRVFIAGDPFDGTRVYDSGGVSVITDEQLERELTRATALDVDFFKTYIRLPDRLQKRVVDYAHEHGRPVTSHELFPAVASGIDGVEHLRGTSRRGYSPKVSTSGIAYRDVIDLLAKSGVTLTPTIVTQGAFAARETGDKALLTDSRLALFPRQVVLMLADLASQRPDPRLDYALKPYEMMLKAVSAAGGTILAGTDAPNVPYGLSLHVELEEYVHAGMTPFQALQTATVNAARALGLEDEIGTIEPGKRADLTFLGSDPLADIRNTRDVRRVMRGGRTYTVKELTKR